LNCHEAQDAMNAYVDGERDLMKAVDVENHIRDCEKCAMIRRNLITLRTSIHDSSLYYRAPLSLERAIRSQVAQARGKSNGWKIGLGAWIAAAALAIIAIGVWVVMRGQVASPEKLLASEVTSAHVRSLMVEHRLDVKSTDQHTVKPWFDGKIDFAPDVRDFKSESFALEGGRLDYLADRPVAALVYRHDKHYINLFIWPAPSQADRDFAVTTHQGYVLLHWVQSGMNYWAVSDTSEGAMRRFASLVHDRQPPATNPAG
jgi:anti-sigma factor RsiW